jgi:co-chaperonin GroES (HSP10)
MKPLRNYIFVNQFPERVYEGGIVIATSRKMVETVSQVGRFGTVEAIGPDIDENQVPVGCTVCYGEFEFPKTPTGEFIITDMDICGVVIE